MELACRLSSGTPAVSNPTHTAPDHKGCPAEDTTIELAAPQATRKFCNSKNRMVVQISRGTTDAQRGSTTSIVDLDICIGNKAIK